MTALIRRLTEADVGLTADAMRRSDWGERRAFLRFAVGHPACYPLVALDDGGVAGTGLATVNGPVGWVGLIWVRPNVRGRGLGRALSERAVADLEAHGCGTQVLVSTEQGEPIYRALGFRQLSRDHVLVAGGLPANARADPSLRPARAEDAAAIAGLDRQATGEDRGHLLAAGTEGWLVVSSGEVRSFALQAPAGGIGIVAPEQDDALRLLALRRRVVGPDGRVRANVLDENQAGLRRLLADGWQELWSGARLVRGPAPAWTPTSIWSVFGHALG